MDRQGVSDRMLAALVVVSLGLAALHLRELPAAWQNWQAGLPDSYPGQHQGLALGALSGLALCLAIPLPLLISRMPRTQRLRRGLLYGAWAVLMGVVVWTLALRSPTYF
jgi:hypothetical protein